MCDVIGNHAGLLQQVVMRIVSAGGSVSNINTAAGDFTLSWPCRAHPAARWVGRLANAVGSEALIGDTL